MPNSSGKSDPPRRVYPPFARPDPGQRRPSTHTRSFNTEPFREPIPDIDEFLDELPMIDELLLGSESGEEMIGGLREPGASEINVAGSSSSEKTDSDGWADADWQSYDWSGLGALQKRSPESSEADAEWSSTNWDSGRPTVRALRDPRRVVEDDVAEALDEIARRIRSGELSIEQFRGTPPEVAIAAVFAALLRSKG